MLRLYGGLAERYAASFVAAALAALSLACIAAWSEGRVPRWALLWTFVPNVAANIAAAWTITRWRAEGGKLVRVDPGGKLGRTIMPRRKRERAAAIRGLDVRMVGDRAMLAVGRPVLLRRVRV